ncbi:MAG: acetyltransferase, family [Firmicutes bacterium]|nr:acetyltransferase, family [Bacillota bacterium]
MNYKYIKGYQANNNLMKSYYNFTQNVFDFDLIDWKNAGHWNDKYILHSLVYNDHIIANISACIMQLQILGNQVSAIQLGSVGVLPEYRARGLSRILMEKVLQEYNQIPLIFLFANHNVLDFYPKFDFRRIIESVSQIDVSDCCAKRRKPTKINIGSACLKRLLNQKLQRSSILDARGNLSTYWFHLLYNYSENIYYIEDNDIVFIVKYQGECAIIIDVLSTYSINIDEIIGYLLLNDTKKVYFHFTPDWLLNEYDVISDDDDIMYVLGQFSCTIPGFKFPVTAHT